MTRRSRRRPLAALAVPALLWLVTGASLALGLIGDGGYDLAADIGLGSVVGVALLTVAARLRRGASGATSARTPR